MGAKQIVRRWVFSLAALIVFSGCNSPSMTLNEVYWNPRDIWGEWIRVDTGATWIFGSNYRFVDMGNEAKIEKQSDNVIKITEPGKTDIYLFASRLPTSSFSGRVVDVGSLAPSVNGGRAISSLGGMNIVITNANDHANTVTAQTNTEGDYTATNVIAGDEYVVTVGNETARVMVSADGDDVGTITVVRDGVNFKTTLERRGDSANQDLTRLWPYVTYYFNIVIENTGDKDCLAPSYEINYDRSAISLSGTDTSGQLRTIEPGPTNARKIPIEIACYSVEGESENKKLDITINSALDGRSWNDSVSLKFNQEYVYLNIRSDDGLVSGAVSGIIIVPGAKAYSFTAAQSNSKPYSDKGPYKTYIRVPKYYGQDYLLVFSGASANDETFYAFSISSGDDGYQDAPSLSGFTDTAAGEAGRGNASEDTATPANPEEGFRAYLHKNDVDFYKVRF
jgi:hypothetical protein